MDYISGLILLVFYFTFYAYFLVTSLNVSTDCDLDSFETNFDNVVIRSKKSKIKKWVLIQVSKSQCVRLSKFNESELAFIFSIFFILEADFCIFV